MSGDQLTSCFGGYLLPLLVYINDVQSSTTKHPFTKDTMIYTTARIL